MAPGLWAWRYFFALFLFAAGSAGAEPFHGYVYELGTGRKTPLFTLKRTEAREPDGTRMIEGFYTALNSDVGVPGKEAVHEIARVKNHKLLKIIQEQNQVQAWGALETRGSQIHFEWVDARHEIHIGDEEYPPNLIVGATSIDYLRDHWGDILEGKAVEARFAVLERQETIGFRFILSRRERRGGRDLVHVLMKPNSIFVQMVLRPFEMVFDRKNVRLLELRGRVGLKRRAGRGWKDIETEMVYEYDDAGVPDSQPRR